jgi:fused signal recognition particle receptor
MSEQSIMIWFGIGILFLLLAFWWIQKSALSQKKKVSSDASIAEAQPNVLSDRPSSVVRDEGALVSAVSSPQAAESKPVAAVSLPWFARLTAGLSKTQTQITRQIEMLFLSGEAKASRESLLDHVLEILVRADVGVRTAERLVDKVRQTLPAAESVKGDAVIALLRSEILEILRAPEDAEAKVRGSAWSLVSDAGQETRVVLMVGVNGVGKTTTTGKLAFQEAQSGRKVIVGAADTFRAAAVDQLEEWSRRAGAECVRLNEGADPASVAFECVKRARAQSADLCLVDTAGRLHNRADLMQELAKIKRVASKDFPGAPHEVLLVLDATTGQNALQQAKAFKEIAGVTGLVLTKLDGTAKGGVAIALAAEMNLPIRYVGVGETVEDLHLFNALEFVDALFQAVESAPAQPPSWQPQERV